MVIEQAITSSLAGNVDYKGIFAMLITNSLQGVSIMQINPIKDCLGQHVSV